MTKKCLWFAFAICLGLTVPVSAQGSDERRVAWNQPQAPFRIIGNVYFVGTAALGAYLITGPQGHVLIDGALPESASQIAANIRKLGFRPRDVKYLLINHSHYDHSGGLAALKKATGAHLLASVGDKPDLEAGRTIGRADISPFPPVKVDRVIRDGELVKLGPIALTAHLTPGHTRGCTSWTFPAESRTVIFACSLTVAGQQLAGNASYPDAAADFRRSFAKLRTIKADVFLNFHTEFFNMQGKLARLKAGDANAFVDPAELGRQVDQAEADFLEELAASAS